MATNKWVARRAFGYCGRNLDRGQIFEAQGARNDEKLERLGFMRRLKRADPVAECGRCQQQFVGDGERDGHVKFRHLQLERAQTEEERVRLEEQHQEREERITEETAPLHLDKTAATLAGRAGR